MAKLLAVVADGDTGETDAGETPSFLLRLISGPHAGAEVLLDGQDPRVVLGSGEGADVVLADALVEPEHVEISLREGKLFIRSLGGRVFVGGKPIDEEMVPLLPFQFVTVGTTQLVGGPAEGEWPQLRAGDAPRLEELVTEVPAEVLAKVKVPTLDARAAKAAHGEAVRVKQRRKRIRIMLAGALVLFGVIVALALRPEEKKLNLGEVAKILQAQVADLNLFPAVTVTLENGQMLVDGYVTTNMELRELRNTLTATYPGVLLRVRSGEKIVEGLEEILSEMGGNLRVVTLQPGIFSVVGYVYNTDRWQRIRDRLSIEVPGVKKIQPDVTTPDRILALTAATLNQYALGTAIAVTPEANRILFKGKLSVLQLENWRKAAEDFIRTFSDLVALEFDVQTASAQTEAASNSFFPTAIQSITISSSGMSWVATTDGKRYFHGSFLPSGWRVDAIAVDGLRLSKDGRQVTMHLEALQ
ncbi:MAG: type III secretion system inner membrane ring subunit SctD [Puniceicoccales bacterium]|jgi:type III secretion system YscD/HrpQ family protein|nr:type III secretion system inner membrane ring subunit SctD [Puniceicoccales bacterium]